MNIHVPDAEHFTGEILALCKAKWIHYIIAKAWGLFGHLFFEVDIEQEIINEKTGYAMLIYFEQLLGRAKIRNLILLTISQIISDTELQILLNWGDAQTRDSYSFCQELNNRAQALWGRIELHCIVRGEQECLVLFQTSKTMQDFILFMIAKSSGFRGKMRQLGYSTMFLVDSDDGRQFLAGRNTRDDFCNFPGAAGYTAETGRMLISEYRWFAQNKLTR